MSQIPETGLRHEVGQSTVAAGYDRNEPDTGNGIETNRIGLRADLLAQLPRIIGMSQIPETGLRPKLDAPHAVRRAPVSE